MLTSALILSLMLSPAAEVVERDGAAIQPQSQGPQLGWGMSQGAAPPVFCVHASWSGFPSS